ncbi:Rieske (2Fe-2S) protein [Pyrobaculum ferrireducens]|uniref:Rieske (2Fe-2S) domain protein n=1 Tax=Pyrobaculum ferrireducens TaxID=1104324 RepID=G7VHJ4_9CREN|nr:Rieske 2Fe-2S domain-containing protein [Pyrobaculum ferrireducens]AET33285.1 Rieske (2Fe-2S) domain protein [Pyrobaculum ferrireducens]
MVRQRIAGLGELPDKTPVPKTVGTKALVVVRDGKTVYVCDGVCPHGRWLLSLGTYENGKLRCKGHGAVYDLATGQGFLNGYPLQIKVYKSEVVGEEVYVEI